MPTDLETIETRLRATLTAAADQTAVGDDSSLASVTPLPVAMRRSPSPRRAWLVVAVAAALLLVVGVVAASRRAGDGGDVTAATTPPAPPAPALVVGYVPSSIPAVPPLTVAVGARGEWASPDGATLVIQSNVQPFRNATSAAAFGGQDGLAFVSKADAQVGLLKDQQDDIKARYSDVFEHAKTAPPDQQEILKAQKDSLVKQSADLDAQIVAVEKTPGPLEGGRDDLTITISGTVGMGELRKVATGLTVTAPPSTAPGTVAPAPVSDAAGTNPTTPPSPTVPDPPSTTTTTPAVATDHPGTPAFTAPLPAGWTLGNGQYSSSGTAPFATDFAEPLIKLPPEKQPAPGFWTWTYTSAAADSGTATITTLYEWQHLGGSLVTDGGTSAPAPAVETTAAGLSFVDLGQRCPVDPQAVTPYVTPCGHVLVVWNRQTVEAIVIGDPSVDAVGYARSLTPRS